MARVAAVGGFAWALFIERSWVTMPSKALVKLLRGVWTGLGES